MNGTATSGTMRAAVAERYGGADAIEVRELPCPEPGPGEVRVRVHAASLNPLDVMLRDGDLRRSLPLRFPAVLGLDLAGVVDRTGPGVSEFQPGDRVYGRTDRVTGGTHATHAVAAARVLDRFPERLGFEEAASLPLVGMTALQALAEAAGLRAGQRLFVVGATGGVGSLAVQVGRALGASVTAMVSTHGLALARELGAVGFVDHSRGELERHGEVHDVVFDTTGRRSYGELARLIAPGGSYVTTGFSPSLGFRIALSRVGIGPRVHTVISRADGERLRRLGAWVAEGRIRAVLDSTYPLDRVRDAYERLERGHPLGKVVLVVP